MAALLLLLLMAAMASVLGAAALYRPLDGTAIYIGGVMLFLLPLLVLVVGRSRASVAWFSRIFAGAAAVALLLLAVAIYANGAWDQNPPTTINTMVAGKVTSSIRSKRRSNPSHVLRVKSWRTGRDEERLYVDEATYNYARIGSRVSVEVHAGFLGWAWYDRVLPGP
jgi:peptidoglycan/LPS O-acetylase OafA/YrhL